LTELSLNNSGENRIFLKANMHFFNVKAVVLAAAVAQLASSHTLFTNLYVDGANMGNGTCVRMSNNQTDATAPIKVITSNDMACGMFSPNVLGIGSTSCVLVLLLLSSFVLALYT